MLSASRLSILDRSTGVAVAEVEFPVAQGGVVFPDNSTIYTGGEDGALSAVQLTPGGQIAVQKVWQGDAALTLLAATSDGESMLIADALNTLRLLSIRDGQLARLSLVLPSTIRELAVARVGSRVLVRTPRWIHEASLGRDGLTWTDAHFAAAGSGSNELVFVSDAVSPRAVAHRVIADGGAIRLERVHDEDRPGLFGSRHNLLEDWPERLGRHDSPAAGQTP